MASPLDVGKKLVSLCKQNKNLDAVNTLYAPNVVSLDAHGDEKMPARMEGLDAVRKKNEWFFNTHDIHSQEAFGPWPHGERFIVMFRIDCTPKEGPMKGKRMKMEEAGLYTVKDGKVVQEEFFYDMGGQ